MPSKEGKSSASRIVCKGLDATRVNSAGEAVSRYRPGIAQKDCDGPLSRYESQNRGIFRLASPRDWSVDSISPLSEETRFDCLCRTRHKTIRPPRKNYFQEIAGLARFGICVVAGNDDPADTRQLMTGRSVYPVHPCALLLGRFAIVGVDGAPLSNDLRPKYNLGYLLVRRLNRRGVRWTRSIPDC